MDNVTEVGRESDVHPRFALRLAAAACLFGILIFSIGIATIILTFARGRRQWIWLRPYSRSNQGFVFEVAVFLRPSGRFLPRL